jgi:hypothetical protein
MVDDILHHECKGTKMEKVILRRLPEVHDNWDLVFKYPSYKCNDSIENVKWCPFCGEKLDG